MSGRQLNNDKWIIKYSRHKKTEIVFNQNFHILNLIRGELDQSFTNLIN